MKRQEWNSKVILARLASFTRHLFSTILVLRFFPRPRESKDMYGWRQVPNLPASAQANPYDEASDQPSPAQELSPVPLRRRSLHVALVDDNMAILDFLETTLGIDGHAGDRYTEGQSLLDGILPPSSDAPANLVPPYDLIILDLLLPGRLSGADVFLAIRRRFTAAQLPIIVITAVDELTLQQFRLILPDDVPLLRKPFSSYVLRHLITQLIDDGS